MGPTSIQRNQEHRYNSTGGIGEQMCENGPPLAKKKYEKNVELNKALCWIIQGYMLSMLVASFTHFWLLCRRGKEKREREREKDLHRSLQHGRPFWPHAVHYSRPPSTNNNIKRISKASSNITESRGASPSLSKNAPKSGTILRVVGSPPLLKDTESTLSLVQLYLDSSIS